MILVYHTLSLGFKYTIFSPLCCLGWNAGNFCFQAPFSASLNGTVWVDVLAAHKSAFHHHNSSLPSAPRCVWPSKKQLTFLHLPIPTCVNSLAFCFFRLSSLQPAVLSQLDRLAYSHRSNNVYHNGYPVKRGSECIQSKLVHIEYNPHLFSRINQCQLDDCHIHSATLMSTQRPVNLPNNHQYGTTTSSRKWPVSVSNQSKVIRVSVPKNMTQDMDAVSSWSAFTEGLAAVQGWKTKHKKSTIPSYTNINLFTKVWGVAKLHDQDSQSDSDIESLTLGLWYGVSDIECWTLSVWHPRTLTWKIKVYCWLQDTCW